MKNLIPGLFLVLLVVAAWGYAEDFGICKPKDDSSKAIWIIDDFEDGDLDGWAAPTGACTMTNDGTIGANSTLRSIRIDGACGHFGGTWFDMGGSAVTNLSYWVRSGSITENDGYLLADDSDLNTGYILVLALGHNGQFSAYNAGDYSLGPYTADTWYSVSIDIDWIGSTYDITIDGEKRGWNLGFADPSMTGIDRLHLYNFDSASSVAWWDQFSASTPPVSTEIMSDGFESADDTGWSLSNPALAPRLVLYLADGVSGAIGGRLGADILCGQAAEGMDGLPLHARTRAFISVNSSDEIQDSHDFGVPVDRIITGPGLVKIADDWADLLDGTIDTTLYDAGVTGPTSFWYSGSNSDGSITNTTCSGWTDGSTSLGGTYGRLNQTGSGWISTSQATCGLSGYSILCLAWRQ